MEIVKEGNCRRVHGGWKDGHLKLQANGVLSWKIKDNSMPPILQILRPMTYAVPTAGSFTMFSENGSDNTVYQVADDKEAERWAHLINLVRVRTTVKSLHEHPLTLIENTDSKPETRYTCSSCNIGLHHHTSFRCEFCDDQAFQLCAACHDQRKSFRSPFVKSKHHKHELMRFERALEPKFFPRAYNNGSFVCSVCDGTSDGPVYHCVECGEYDECSKCIGDILASPFAIGKIFAANGLGSIAQKRQDEPDPHQIRLEPRLLSKAFDTDGKSQYTLNNTKNVPQAASMISNHCWDLSKIESEPVPHAYFEVTFDKFDKTAVVGVGIGNQIFVQNQLLGLQQNSFGYLSNGGIAKNGDIDYGNEGPKILPGDTVGAGVLYDSYNQRRFYFTKNGKKLDYNPKMISDFIHNGMDCFPGVSFTKTSHVTFTVNFNGPFKFDPKTVPNYRPAAYKQDRLSKQPHEVLINILAYAATSINFASDLRRVSKIFSVLAADNEVWRPLFLTQWPNQNPDLKLKSWMTLYKRRSLAENKRSVTEVQPIENCNLEFVCPLLWESLEQSTPIKDERFCDKCKKTVYKVGDVATLKDYAERGRCVSLVLEPIKPLVPDMWMMHLGGPPPPMDWNVPPIPPPILMGPDPPMPPPPMAWNVPLSPPRPPMPPPPTH